MKKRKVITIIVMSLLTLSVCSVGFIAHSVKASDTSILSDEEKSRMIEERKEERRKYGGMTTEEELRAKGEYSILEEIENAKAKANSTEEGIEGQKNVEDLLKYYDEIDNERENAVLNMLKESGKYPNGYDKERFIKDEDYYLECICDVCVIYNELKETIVQEDTYKIEDYLDAAYNDIVHWYPQSDKSKKTYELIEDTLNMENVYRMIKESPLTFKGFKRSEVR